MAVAEPEAEAPPPPPLLIPEARAEEILSVAGGMTTLPEVERFTEHRNAISPYVPEPEVN